MKDDGHYTDAEIVQFRQQLKNGNAAAMRESSKRAIFDWIKDDLPLAQKMMMRPEHVEKLLDRLVPASA